MVWKVLLKNLSIEFKNSFPCTDLSSFIQKQFLVVNVSNAALFSLITINHFRLTNQYTLSINQYTRHQDMHTSKDKDHQRKG